MFLFAPEPNGECTRSYDSKYTGPDWDLNASSRNRHLENDAQQMEYGSAAIDAAGFISTFPTLLIRRYTLAQFTCYDGDESSLANDLLEQHQLSRLREFSRIDSGKIDS
jgi:hypothetical protein